MSKNKTDIFQKAIDIIGNTYSKAERLQEKLTSSVGGRRFCWIMVVLFCFSIVLLLNILTPFISDDYAYLYIFGESTRVTSLGDIVQSQINHYEMWGGRSVVHFVAQVLLLLPSYLADALNSLIFIGYTFLIYLHIVGKNRGSISLFVLINLAVWFMQPVIGDTILWLTGAANYLWGTFFILLFLLPFRLYNGNSKLRGISVWLASFGFFLFGIIAGWTNENTAGAMILIGLFFIYYYKSSGWKLPMWAVAGLIGAVIGFVVMIMAPGNFARGGDATSLSLYILAYRIFSWTYTFLVWCGPLLLISMLLLVGYNRFYQGNRDKGLRLGFIYAIAAITAVYAMLLSPTFPRRAMFGIVTYLIIAGGIWFYNMDFSNRFLRQIRSVLILFGGLYFIFTLYYSVEEINIFRNISKERDIIVEEAKTSGFDYCEFERYDGGRYIHGEDPFSEVSMSRYYGITIKLKGRCD